MDTSGHLLLMDYPDYVLADIPAYRKKWSQLKRGWISSGINGGYKYKNSPRGCKATWGCWGRRSVVVGASAPGTINVLEKLFWFTRTWPAFVGSATSVGYVKLSDYSLSRPVDWSRIKCGYPVELRFNPEKPLLSEPHHLSAPRL
jgi:hypothetical protein